MIEAKELRIGNWVIFNDNTDRYGRIIELRHHAKLKCRYTPHHNEKEVTETNRDYEWLRPIPLTPEILEKAGFKITNMGGHYNDIYMLNNVEIADASKVTTFGYCHEYNRESSGRKHFTGLDYLHQLQNLYFALTREELEFNPVNK